MHWNDPNWVAAYGQWAGAIASFFAVIVALGIAIYSGRQAQKQARATSLPRLVIDSDGTDLWQKRNLLYLDWSTPFLTVSMKNVGTGPAFNIVSVIYGAESYPGTQGTPRQKGTEGHWTFWGGNLMQPGEMKSQQYNVGASTFYQDKQSVKDRKKQYSLHAPPVPNFKIQNPEPNYIARITTTYQDIHGRKHAKCFQ